MINSGIYLVSQTFFLVFLSNIGNVGTKSLNRNNTDAVYYFCGPHRNRCTKDVHACLHNRCESCEGFRWACYTENHVPNCTNFCRDIVIKDIKKHLSGDRNECLKTHLNRSINESVSTNSTGNKDCWLHGGVSLLLLICTPVGVGLVVQLINIFIISTFYKRNENRLDFFKIFIRYCGPKGENKTDETVEKQPFNLGCQTDEYPTPEVGDEEKPINLHSLSDDQRHKMNRQNIPKFNEIINSQDDDPKLVVSQTEASPDNCLL